MEAEKATYPVQRMARLLGVSRSGFYAWRRRSSEASERAVVRAEFDAKVRLAHADSSGTYGPLGSRPHWPGTGPALTGRLWPPRCAGRAWKGSLRGVSGR